MNHVQYLTNFNYLIIKFSILSSSKELKLVLNHH